MIFKKAFLFCFLGSLICLSSCFKTGEKKKTGLVVVNVLDKVYFDDCRIKDSIHVLFDKVKDLEKTVDKGAEVVFYCSNYRCTASGIARKQLLDMGYKNVLVYEGGIAEWHQKGYPTEGPCEKDYLKKEVEIPEEKADYIITAEELKKKMEK